MSALLLTVACDGPTQYVVVVDSDIAELTRVQVTVSADVHTAGHSFEIEETGIPFSFGLSRGPAATDDLRLSFNGYTDAFLTAYVSRTIQTQFLEGPTRTILVGLNRDCAGRAEELGCADTDTTCEDGACRSIIVPPTDFDVGVLDVNPMMPDAGPPIDAGPGDAGTDCMNGTPCSDPENPCRNGVMVCDRDVAGCEIDDSMTLPEGAMCGAGRTCDREGVCRGRE